MFILVVLANTENNTVEEIAEKTGVKKDAVYHLLEFLTIAGIVKKEGNKYSADGRTRTIARLMLDFPDDFDISN